jgi:hypothetical protein
VPASGLVDGQHGVKVGQAQDALAQAEQVGLFVFGVGDLDGEIQFYL